MKSLYYVVKVEGVSWVTDKYEIMKATDRSARYQWVVLGNFMHENSIYDSPAAAKTFCTHLEFTNTITVEPLDPGSVLEAVYISARVHREVLASADKLKGLAESFINDHLSPEVKEILKRAPEDAEAASALLMKGINSALEKLGKGK